MHKAKLILSLKSGPLRAGLSGDALARAVKSPAYLPIGITWAGLEAGTGPASPSLRYFGERLKIPHLYQIHLEGKEDVLDGMVRVMPAPRFLAGLV